MEDVLGKSFLLAPVCFVIDMGYDILSEHYWGNFFPNDLKNLKIPLQCPN